jgi:hypothetical protein
MCRKRKVNLLIDPSKLDKLNEYAKSYGVRRSDLLRLAIRNFELKHTPGIKPTEYKRNKT